MNDTNPNSLSNFPMPRGLPRSIGIDQSGYERLNQFLRITRKQRKAILENKWARQITRSIRDEISGKRLPAGERDRRLLLWLYGDPDFRQSMWESTFEKLVRGDEFEPDRIPTIEHIALSEFFYEIDSDEENKIDVKEAFGEWPDLAERISGTLPWAAFAVGTWKQLNEKIGPETALSDQDNELLSTQIFSIATIVNDVRLIHSIARRATWLEHEFSELLTNSKSVVERAQTEDSATDLTEKWNQCCRALSSVALEASGVVPKPEALAEMRKLIEEMNSFEGLLRAELEMGQFSEFSTNLKSLFGTIENESCFAWLNRDLQNEIENLWFEVWDSIAPNVAVNAFSALNEFVQEIIERNRETARSLESAQQSLDSLGDLAPPEFEKRHQWEEDRDKAEQHVIDCKRAVRTAEKELYQALDPTHTLDKRNVRTTQRKPDEAIPTTENDVSSDEKSDTKEPPETPRSTKQPNIEELPEQTRKQSDEVVKLPEEEAKEKPKQPPKRKRPNKAVKRITEALLETPPNLAYAYQVARLAQKVDKNFPEFETAVLKTALYSNCLRHPDGKIALALQTEFGKFSIPLQFENESARDTFSLLTLAATLRPSLLAPVSGAFGFLSGIRTSSDLEAVYSFANTVSQKTNVLQNVRVDSLVLGGTRSEASWEKEYSTLIQDTKTWRDQSRNLKISYTPANKVWLHWQKSDELLGQLISYVFVSKKDGHFIDSVFDQRDRG